MTAPGPKNPMSKDMRAYLKSRYPNKDLDKLWAESTAMRRHGWQKNLKVWLRLKKIPGIEKLGKINPGDGAYNEKVRLLKQFNELKPTYKSMGKGTGTVGAYTERPFTLKEWLEAGPERRKYGRMSKTEYLDYRKKESLNVKKFKALEKKRLTPEAYDAKYLAKKREEGFDVRRKELYKKRSDLAKSGRGALQETRNLLLSYMSTAAKKEKAKGVTNPQFTEIIEGEKFVGVRDNKGKINYYEAGYTKPLKSGSKLITNHPQYQYISELKKLAGRFKYELPNKAISAMFINTGRLPTMGELGNFLTVDPKLVGKYSQKFMGRNPLQLHHIMGVEVDPAKRIQLRLRDQNDMAGKIVKRFQNQSISKADAIKELKRINVSADIGGEVVGATEAVSPTQQIGAAKRRINQLFFERLKTNPNLVKEITDRFEGLTADIARLKPGTKAFRRVCMLYKQEGGSVSSCVAATRKDPVGMAQKLATLPESTGVLGNLKNKATGFLGMLGRGGARAAPYAAIAAVGAAAEPLVKQFRNDDPTTYLSNPEQQKGMLLSMVEQETPKVDEEILKWQYPGQIAGAAAAIPGSGAMYKARRLNIGKPKMGMARAALGPVGKVLAGSFSPLGVAASLPIGIAAQVKGGSDIEDIATDPFNWLGPAFASAGSEMATKGVKNPLLLKALRLGMSPRTLMLGSRFLGLPGLALSAGLWGYDKWKDRDEE